MEERSPINKRRVAGVSPLKAGKKRAPPKTGGTQMTGSIVVDQPQDICYRFWRDFKNLPQFLKHVQAVVSLDDRRTHWTVSAPADTTVEWDAELIKDVPPERISWRSIDNAQIDNAGSVEFKPLEDNRTEVKVVMTYNLGPIGEVFSGLFGANPDQHLQDDLLLFKKALETGRSHGRI